ncbi:MAG: hypothetical protein IBJ18_02120 [Phycisphaerales bacterium]|nr:hypothetical protein [Phycisphaerales bacterium]
MWRAVLSVVVVAICGLMLACGGCQLRDGEERSMRAEGEVGGVVRGQVVCVRLEVPGAFREPSGLAEGCFGLVFVVSEGWAVNGRSVGELLENGEIAARFRSAREARHVIADRFAKAGDAVSFVTARHEHDAVWSVCEEPLPERDRIMGDPKVWSETEIGSADSGVGAGVRVVGLPTPLGERGVAIVQRVTKGRALHWVPPRDRNVSLSTSWDELIGWIERVGEVEDFFVWNDGGLNRGWAELRRRVDLSEEKP